MRRANRDTFRESPEATAADSSIRGERELVLTPEDAQNREASSDAMDEAARHPRRRDGATLCPEKSSRLVSIILVLFIIVLVVVGIGLWWFNLWPFVGRAYTMTELGLEVKQSAVDFDMDGVDDYADLLAGARKDAENHPWYDGSYVQGGYPADDIGVCTDVIWRAFREAGYDLKAMVDADIVARQGEYRIGVPDPNIDFRRVKNLEIFLEKYTVKLANDWQEDLEAWQPGDIVVFDNGGHIGIVSDRRTREGRPYIIHNAGQPMREEDYLKRGKVTGHYRFDASKIDTEVLKKWGEE